MNGGMHDKHTTVGKTFIIHYWQGAVHGEHIEPVLR